MKKLLFWLMLLSMPFQGFAVNNLKLNGVSEYTLTTLPSEVVLTCDLSGTGSQVEMEVFLDVNQSGQLEPTDFVVVFSIITDGIGWIRDPENPDEDISGDETPVDGKIKTTFPFEEDITLFKAGQFIVKLTEQDGSTATALLKIVLQAEPPLIIGKIMNAQTGAALPNILVFADKKDDAGETNFGISDQNGDYFINVEAGDWQVMAMDFIKNEYMPSDSFSVTLAEGQTKSLNIQLTPYTSFVTGETKKEDGTPVPGITILAGTVDGQDFSIVKSNKNGQYKIGVTPGKVAVGTLPFEADSEWPEGYFVEPEADTLQVASGQTVNLDFIFKPYTAFVEGDCKVNDQPLPGVEITAMIIDLQAGAFRMSSTMSDANGHYKLGVMPGNITMLMANKDGFDMIEPTFGYSNIMVQAGQTISGKDFIFQPNDEGISISGTVTMEGGAPVDNVYVAAVYEMPESSEDFLITYTNATGQYEFNGLELGHWKVGVYKSGYQSDPAMIYENIYPGVKVTNADFVLTQAAAVDQPVFSKLPNQFKLLQNYPNPFNTGGQAEKTIIGFFIQQPKPVEIAIYNIQGQFIRQLLQGKLAQGQHQVEWDGRNLNGQLVPSGIYFYRIKVGEHTFTRPLTIVR